MKKSAPAAPSAVPAYLHRRAWEDWVAEVQGDGEPLPLPDGSRLGPLLRRLPPKDMRLPAGRLDAGMLARFDFRPLPDLPGLGAAVANRAPLTVAARRDRHAAQNAALEATARQQSSTEALAQLEQIEAGVCVLAKAVLDCRPVVADERRWIPPQSKAQSNRQRAAQLLDDANVAQLEAWEREYRTNDKAVAAVRALRLAIVAELARRRSGEASAAAGLGERERRDAVAAREQTKQRVEALEGAIFRLAAEVEAARPAGVAEGNWLRDVGRLPPRRVSMLLSQPNNRAQVDDWILGHGHALAAAGATCLHQLAQALGEYAQIIAEREKARAEQPGQEAQKRKRKPGEGAHGGGAPPPSRARLA